MPIVPMFRRSLYSGGSNRNPSLSRTWLSRYQSSLPTHTDLLDRYRALVTLGQISYNEEQVRVVMKLRRLRKELLDYAPPALSARLLASPPSVSSGPPWWIFSEAERQFDEAGMALVAVRGHAEELAALDTPQGLLLIGPPGSGKSFLVDLWYESISTLYKARKHYNQLVLEVYRGVWEETRRRMASSATTGGVRAYGIDADRGPWNRSISKYFKSLVKSGSSPIRWSRNGPYQGTSTDPSIAFVVAKRLLLHHWLLVFDEIQLLDVSSANLLADVLSWYWRMGGVIVGTSNKVPEELYTNGVQRERLEPFVEALKARCPVTVLDTQQDFRSTLAASSGRYQTWFTFDQSSEFGRIVDGLTGNMEPQRRDMHVFGRTLTLPWTVKSVCKLSFSDLCSQSLGAADYLTIASNFPTVVIADIPVLSLSKKDQARRFISLIDALYETRCKVICLAESGPEELFFPDALEAASEQNERQDIMAVESVAETQDVVYRPNVASYDSPGMQEAPVETSRKAPLVFSNLSIFSGEEERFAFKRALSRLQEMTSAAYNRSSRWSPLPSDQRQWEHSSLSFTGQEGGRNFAGAVTALDQSLSLSSSPELDDREQPEEVRDRSSGDVLRPHAPRLSPDHFWGVRDDWGRMASEWGQGVKSNQATKHSHNTSSEDADPKR